MIVYSLVARGKIVLAENTNTSGNFEVIARMVLSKLSETENHTKRSVELETHVYHVLPVDDLVFVALAERSLEPKLAFAFLNEISSRFISSFKRKDWEHAIAHSFNAEFSGVLSLLMARYNNGDVKVEDERVRKVQQQIEDVKDIMRTNIDSLLNRGERIELLVDTTERLTQASFKFQESATRLKNQIWWKNRKNQLILLGIFIVVVFLIVATSCGGLDFGNC